MEVWHTYGVCPLPYIAKEDIVETFIMVYLSNSIKRLLRNNKTGVLSSSDVLPNTVELCIGERTLVMPG